MARPVLQTGSSAAVSSHRISMSFICLVTMILLGLPIAHSQREQTPRFYVENNVFNILVDATQLFHLMQVGEFNTTLEVTSKVQYPDLVQLVPSSVTIPKSENPNASAVLSYEISAYAKSPGHTYVTFDATPTGFVDMEQVFLRITVMHSRIILIISEIMGWVYFIAWSVSFYPQIYINFKRKSVVGLNFDFLALNIMGFTLYSVFNCGLFFSKAIQAEYFERHPRSLNPVQLNDVFFSLHAAFATIVTIAQCFIYEREDQRVSMVGRGILTVFGGIVIVTASLGAADKLEWLDFIGYCSYIKLCITLIKYVPQAYMNYKRKSTVGWSIGNIFLDFTGGLLSILQMMLNAYNYQDWVSFFGDATKFGLGLFSLIFDIFFMLQHYVFYRHARYILLPGGNSRSTSSHVDNIEGRDDEPTFETPYQDPPEVT
ncbi:cystinosin homolog isoform X2 [Hyposmocoma kahamanoa]|uniref:cystinosin homolog isoform X2 n=1 Tax=Hyposmocoma kahamanoa TaxID=1477025 RepID=UPI000E6DA296|nr:cystinosin homolog isoform X2 [Hyposmocoma kahamanoa]